MTPSLSRFTPSLMPREVLERLFVARERTLDAIMERVAATATGEGRNHTLLVGPRGAGKTHLVSLVYHRTKQLQADGLALQPAWLPEDPWTLVSYRHLLTEIAKRLEPAIDGSLPRAEAELEALLAQRASEHGPIVVIVENLDQILDALGDDGQQRLRHLLQADRSLLLVATSTRLDRSLSDQASPFYAFFTTTRLEPFDLAQAGAMLTAIAEERDDQQLVVYLASDEGHTRLRTICHLAGGQPRMWAALASALTVEGLGELVELLLARFDDLTPYYQEQLGRLSNQQRLAVAELAELDRPINVKDLAERLEIDQRSLGKTMSELVDRGWATPTTSSVTALIDKRRTYYELAEPLARLSFQIKESRGEPLRLIVEFLKHWFDPSDLRTTDLAGVPAEYVTLAVDGHSADPVVAATRWIQRLPSERLPTIELLGQIDIALAALGDDDAEPFLRLPTPVRAALEPQVEGGVSEIRCEIHNQAQTAFGHARQPSMDAWIARAEQLLTSCTGDTEGLAQLVLADWLGRAWRFDEADAVLSAAARADGTLAGELLLVRSSLLESRWQAGHGEGTISLGAALVDDYESTFGSEHPATLTGRANLAATMSASGRHEEAIGLLEAVLLDRERLLGSDNASTLSTRSNLATAYWRDDRVDEAVRLGERVVADCLRLLGRHDRRTLLAHGNLASYYSEAGRLDEAIALNEQVIADQQRVLRSDDPEILRTRANLASMYSSVGRVVDAIKLEEEVLADTERSIGLDHPNAITVRGNLAASYWRAGRFSEGRAQLAEALARAERVLGPEHPVTAAARSTLRPAREDREDGELQP